MVATVGEVHHISLEYEGHRPPHNQACRKGFQSVFSSVMGNSGDPITCVAWPATASPFLITPYIFTKL